MTTYTTPQETRAAIIRSATEIMSKVGPGKLRVAEVARAAGMTTGAIYAHFIDRQDLISAVRAEQVRTSHQDLTMHAAERLKRIRAIVDSGELLSKSAAYRETQIKQMQPSNFQAAFAWIKNTVAAEFDEPLDTLMRGIWNERTAEIHEVLEKAKSEKIIADDVDLQAYELIVLSFYYGMTVISRTMEIETELAEKVVDTWQRMLSATEPS